MIRSRHSMLLLAATCAPLLAGGCTGAAEDRASSAQAVISDATHAGGTPGFYWLSPMVPAPSPTGVFEPAATPTVRIDRLAADGSVAANVATFTGTSGPGGETVRVADGKFQVNWHSGDFDLDPAATYRIRVLVPGGRELGFADVDVVSSGAQLRNVSTREYIPLLDGRTLPIKFRIEHAAVDRDGDGALDWADNCPSTGNADQRDTLGDGVGDACRCDGVTPAALDDHNACTDDRCTPTQGVVHAAVSDGTSCADGDVCNGAETCGGGTCNPGVAPTVDDGNPCTADACDATSGVTHASANEGLVCGAAMICGGGACVAGCPSGQTLCGGACVAGPSHSYLGDGNANDAAGTLNATYANAAYASGHDGQAFAFNGGGQYVALPPGVGDFGAGDFTIAFWFNTTAWGNLLSKRSACWGGPAFTGEDMRMTYSGAISVELWTTTGYFALSTPAGLNNGQWHHLALVRAGGTASLAIDGVAVSTTAISGAMTDPSNTPVYLGVGRCVWGSPGWNGTQDGSAWFSGRIDQVGFFSRAMSASELSATAQGLCR